MSDWVTLPDGTKVHACGQGERLAVMPDDEREQYLSELQIVAECIDKHWDEL